MTQHYYLCKEWKEWRGSDKEEGQREGTLGIGQVQQAGIMHGGVGFTVAKAMETCRSVCKQEFSP